MPDMREGKTRDRSFKLSGEAVLPERLGHCPNPPLLAPSQQRGCEKTTIQ
jgi:hypothetical protein